MIEIRCVKCNEHFDHEPSAHVCEQTEHGQFYYYVNFITDLGSYGAQTFCVGVAHFPLGKIYQLLEGMNPGRTICLLGWRKLTQTEMSSFTYYCDAKQGLQESTESADAPCKIVPLRQPTHPTKTD